MDRLIRLISNRMSTGLDSMLVIIAERQGSTPRKEGTMMLVGGEGPLAGTVGGGAVEWYAITNAASLLQEKSSRLLTCSMNEDLSSGGMICGGSVTLLFLYIAADDTGWREVTGKTLEFFGSRTRGSLIFRLSDGRPGLLNPDGSLAAGGICPVKASKTAASQAEADQSAERIGGAERNGSAGSEGREGEGVGEGTGLLTVPLSFRHRAVVFGGGHVAAELVPLLSRVDFEVTVFENREQFAKKERFPDAARVILGDYEKVTDYLRFYDDDFIIIMTNEHSHDMELERQLLLRKHAYLGVMGSKRKMQLIHEKLKEAGISQELIDTVYTPVGIKIKAETPAEIAVSIAAECIRVRAEFTREH